MDKVKAIKVLKPLVDSYVDYANISMKEEDDNIVEALEMAIEALKAKPCDDAISRQMAIDAFGLSEKTRKYGGDHSGYDTRMLYEIQDTLENLPAVQPDHIADIGRKVSISCGQENDLISRQAALDALWKALYEYEDETEKQFQESEDLDVGDWIGHRIFVQNMSDIDRQTILNLPSAQPELHWIPCSERLPKEKQSVLVTDGSVIWVCDIISTDEGYKWEDSHGYWLDLNEWIAWMKLPELYKEGDAE